MFTTGISSKVDETQKSIDEVKDAAIAYGGISLGLQVVATSAAVVLAYVAWQNYSKRKPMFNPKGKR